MRLGQQRRGEQRGRGRFIVTHIPSRGGRSHGAEQYSAPSQDAQGVEILLNGVMALAG
jgi:hypothetical protein